MIKKALLTVKTFRERSKKFRAKVRSDPVKSAESLEKRRVRSRQNYKENKKSPAFLKSQRERVQEHRLRKKNEDQEEGSEIGNFKANSSFSRAVKKVTNNLPKDPGNQKAVVKTLFYHHFPAEKSKNKRTVEEKELDRLVVDFYNQDDISQQLPGQRDRKVIRDLDGTKRYVQKRVMLLTISETFSEFKKSNPTSVIGKTKFYSLKPFNIDCVSELKQVGCLCTKCENMKLLFSSIRSRMTGKIDNVLQFIEMFSCSLSCDAHSCEVCDGNLMLLIFEMFEEDEFDVDIDVSQWTMDVYHMKLKSESKTLTEIILLLIDRIPDYKHHMIIKASQSSFFKESIATSSDNTVVIQVDFAENFKCVAQNEIQSGYFNQQTIAIFTVVIWAGNKKFSHVYVADDTSHSKYCVVLFLHKIIEDLKKKFPNLRIVKMFSDGCACQFKNRWILSLIAFAQDLFGIELSWDFFAPGHGKGAVDGIGGIVKRVVYQRIMTKKVRIYSAKEFHDCLVANVKGISSTYVSVDEIKKLENVLEPKWKNVKPIPGINKFFKFKKHGEKLIEASDVGSSAVKKIFKIIK